MHRTLLTFGVDLVAHQGCRYLRLAAKWLSSLLKMRCARAHKAFPCAHTALGVASQAKFALSWLRQEIGRHYVMVGRYTQPSDPTDTSGRHAKTQGILANMSTQHSFRSLFFFELALVRSLQKKKINYHGTKRTD